MTYLLTFNCYGNHVPGDERGWVERARGEHRGGYHASSRGLWRYGCEVMKQEPYRLDLPRASVVLKAIREVCDFRDWGLLAAHVRTTHVHLVADQLADPDRAVTDFKSYASRALRREGLEAADRKRWARGGSTRRLPTTEAVCAAIKYVADRQGEPMAVYVADWRQPHA